MICGNPRVFVWGNFGGNSNLNATQCDAKIGHSLLRGNSNINATQCDAKIGHSLLRGEIKYRLRYIPFVFSDIFIFFHFSTKDRQMIDKFFIKRQTNHYKYSIKKERQIIINIP